MNVFVTGSLEGLLKLLGDTNSGAEARGALARSPFPAMLRVFGVPSSRGTNCIRAVQKGLPLEGGTENERSLVRYLVRLWTSRTELRPFLSELARSQSELLTPAADQAEEYLPRKGLVQHARIVLLPLKYDARVDASTVYLDPLLALRVGRDGVRRLLAHELHHVARYALTRQNLSGMPSPRRRLPVRWERRVRLWVSYMEMEGIADRVFDLTTFRLAVHRRMRAERARITRRAPAELQRCQNIFLRAKRRGSVGRRSPEVRSEEPFSEVHPLGAYMAGRIQEAVGTAELARLVGRPGAFIRAYQLASADSGGFLFNDAMVAAVGR